jgi:hypothetical protein
MHATVILAALVVLQPAGPSAGRRVAISPEQGRALAASLAAVDARWRAGQPQASSPLRVEEAGLNSYLSYEVQMPPSLSDVEVRLERDRVAAEGWLDLDQIQDRVPKQDAMISGLLSLVSGRVRVVLRGRLVNDREAGFGSFEIEDASLGPVPLSPAAIAPIVASATRTPSRPGGFDILAPFRYPYGVKRVRLRAGHALLDF